MSDKLLLMIARAYLYQEKRARALYEADVDDWYRAGDGRPPRWRTEVTPDGTDVYQVNLGGRGYTYPACPHGKSQWTDYDNICGPCEDGYSVYEIALMRAYNAMHDFRARQEIAKPFESRWHQFTAEFKKELGEWVAEPITDALQAMNERGHDRTARVVAWRYAMTWPRPELPPTDEAREAQAAYDDHWRS